MDRCEMFTRILHVCRASSPTHVDLRARVASRMPRVLVSLFYMLLHLAECPLKMLPLTPWHRHITADARATSLVLD